MLTCFNYAYKYQGDSEEGMLFLSNLYPFTKLYFTRGTLTRIRICIRRTVVVQMQICDRVALNLYGVPCQNGTKSLFL